MHPLVEPWAFVLGTWEGTGRGLWPAPRPLRFSERIELVEDGRAFIAYRQTTASEDGRPMHTECGYLRPAEDGSVELVVSQPTGIVEVHHGRMDGGRIELRSTLVGHAPTAVNVTAVARTVVVDGRDYRYALSIAVNGEPLAPHLEGHLVRLAD